MNKNLISKCYFVYSKFVKKINSFVFKSTIQKPGGCKYRKKLFMCHQMAMQHEAHEKEKAQLIEAKRRQADLTVDVLVNGILQRAAESATVRADDNEATLKVRIVTFRENTNEIQAQYPDKTVTINAERPVDEIFGDAVTAIDAIVEIKRKAKESATT